MNEARFTIFGECASKANSRELVWRKDKKTGKKVPRFIKSAKARTFEQEVRIQAPKLPILLLGDLTASIRIFYKDNRPDLDESIILDAIQNIIYKNDRQVREKHVYHAIDKQNPRVEVYIRPRGKS